MAQLNINGTVRDVAVEADTPLLWVIREQVGLTGTKYGCGVAQCGACYRQEVPLARAEREMLDVKAEIDRQPLSVRPAVVRTVDDRRIGVAIMIRKLHVGIPC